MNKRNGFFSIEILGLLLFVLVFSTETSAATRTWDGGGADNNWSTAANWSDNIIPVNGDEITFNATNTKNATIDVSVSLFRFTIETGYIGTITQADNITVATTFLMTQSGGTYVGSSGAFTIPQFNLEGGVFQGGTGFVSGSRIIQSGGTFTTAGNVELGRFSLSGGTFNAPAGLMTVVADFTQSGGTFNPNGGTVKFTGFSNCNFPGTATGTIDVATTLIFYNLQFDFAGCFTRSVANGDTLIVNNNLLLTSGTVGGGRIRPNAAVTVDSAFTGGSTIVEFIRSNQTFVINTPATTVAMLGVEMNAANSTLTTSGNGRVNFNSINLLNGTVNQGAGVWDASYSQSNGTFNGSAAALFIGNSSGNPMITGGVFSGGTGKITSSFRMTGGTFSTQGDLDTSLFGLEGGTFNAPSGIMKFTGGNGNCFFTHTAGGTFNAGTGTVEIQQGICGINVNVTETFNNLRFNGNVNELSAGDTLVVNGLLTFNTGGGANSGSIVANGDVIYTNGGGRGSTLVKFQDTETRTINLNASAASYSALNTLVNNPNVTINAGASAVSQVTFSGLTLQQGTVNQGDGNALITVYNQLGGTYNSGTISNSFGSFTLSGGDFNAAPMTTFSGDFTHAAAGGNFNEGTGTTFFSTNGVIDVDVAETFFNVRFLSGNANIAAGDTLIALGRTTLQSGSINGGTLEVKGDVNVTPVNNGGNFQGGTANITFSGATNQTYTNADRFTTLGGIWTINKPNSAPLAVNGYAPAAPTTLLLSGSVGNNNANSYPAFNVVSGNVVQTGNFSHAFGSLNIAAQTSFVNEFSGAITLAGDVTNNGNIRLNGDGAGCQADSILIRSNNATQRNWNGGGTFDLRDVDVSRQAGTPVITVYSGTDSGNNGANWVFDTNCFVPTAASVSISGRVLSADGRGIARAIVTMTDAYGNSRAAVTNPFGNYRFSEVTAGQTITVSVRGKKFVFADSVQVLNVSGNLSEINFMAERR